MDAHRWQLIKALVDGALDQPSEHRDAWLAHACARTPDLIADVRTLIDAAAYTGGFLETGAIDRRTADRIVMASRDGGRRHIGHYELLEWVGAGGMGDVFRARDLALGRDAALKLLPRHFDRELREQLLQEAEASAKLQHPAIATFYEAGLADGEMYIAMEFVRGQTLRDRLGHGPLALDEALCLTHCLLEALAHAHAAGLLHRDIKPENIILTGTSSAKLLDFSIALPLATTAETRHAPMQGAEPGGTEQRRLVGTPGYLAPEQIRGDPLDPRTDVFQVGAVLYEALTGLPAFGGATRFERLAAPLTTEPDFSIIDGFGTSRGLAAILRRALARDVTVRYPSAAAFLQDLQALTDGRPSGLPGNLAVKDFENRTGDQDLDWLGAAIAENIRVHLGGLRDLTLVARDKMLEELASAEARADGGDPVSAALRLGCGMAAIGEITRSDALLSVHGRLVEAVTRRTVVEAYVEGSLDEFLELQDRVARAIAGVFSGPGEAFGHRRRESTVEAHECYTRARLYIDRFGKASLENARVLLERAIASDAHHVDALAALTMTHGLRAIVDPNPADYEAAIAFADRALAIDPQHVRAHAWKGYALAVLGRLNEAEGVLQRALELDANDTDALYFAAAVMLLLRPAPAAAEAVTLLQRAVELDPSHGMWWLALGTAHRSLGSLREAHYSFERARRLEGSPARFATAGAASYMGETSRVQGRLEEARIAALAGIDAAEQSDHAYRDTFRAHGLTVLGRVALDQHDLPAAEAAFRQVLAQARGRPRPRACGHFVVQALSGLARVTRDESFFLDGLALFNARAPYNFGCFYGALDEDTLADLAQAADRIGRCDEARQLRQRTAERGSRRARSQGGV